MIEADELITPGLAGCASNLAYVLWLDLGALVRRLYRERFNLEMRIGLTSAVKFVSRDLKAINLYPALALSFAGRLRHRQQSEQCHRRLCFSYCTAEAATAKVISCNCELVHAPPLRSTMLQSG